MTSSPFHQQQQENQQQQLQQHPVNTVAGMKRALAAVDQNSQVVGGVGVGVDTMAAASSGALPVDVKASGTTAGTIITTATMEASVGADAQHDSAATTTSATSSEAVSASSSVSATPLPTNINNSSMNMNNTSTAKKPRLSFAGVPPGLLPWQQKAYTIYQAIKSFKDENKRPLSKPFQTLPSKKYYPDYYEVIHKPIALQQIKEKLEKMEYASLEEFGADMLQLFENAQMYNMEESEIHQDSLVLKESALVLDVVTPAAKKHHSSGGGGAETPAPVEKLAKEDVKKLYAAIEKDNLAAFKEVIALELFQPNIRQETTMFLDRVRWTPVHCAAFHGRVDMLDLLVREKGADIEIRDKTYGGTALAWATFGGQPATAKQLVRVHHANRFVRNRQAQTPFDLVVGSEMEGPPWKELKLELSREKVEMLADATEIYEIIVSNAERSEMFMDLPSRDDYPDYFKVIQNPMSFRQVQARLNQGLYESLDAFEKDLLTIFENAMVYNEEDSLVYQDAKFLKDLLHTTWKKFWKDADGSSTTVAHPPKARSASVESMPSSNHKHHHKSNSSSTSNSHSKSSANKVKAKMADAMEDVQFTPRSHTAMAAAATPAPAKHEPMAAAADTPVVAGGPLPAMEMPRTPFLSRIVIKSGKSGRELFTFHPTQLVRACSFTLPADESELSIHPVVASSLAVGAGGIGGGSGNGCAANGNVVSAAAGKISIDAAFWNQRKLYPNLAEVLPVLSSSVSPVSSLPSSMSSHGVPSPFVGAPMPPAPPYAAAPSPFAGAPPYAGATAPFSVPPPHPMMVAAAMAAAAGSSSSSLSSSVALSSSLPPTAPAVVYRVSVKSRDPFSVVELRCSARPSPDSPLLHHQSFQIVVHGC